MATEWNFEIDQGSDWTKTLVYEINDVPVNLTGYSARMKGKVSYGKDTAVFSLTTENGGITLGGEAGSITLNLNNLATSAFGFTTLVYDLELVSPGGLVKRLLQGLVTLNPEATR
jgi:hypothetical protein